MEVRVRSAQLPRPRRSASIVNVQAGGLLVMGGFAAGLPIGMWLSVALGIALPGACLAAVLRNPLEITSEHVRTRRLVVLVPRAVPISEIRSLSVTAAGRIASCLSLVLADGREVALPDTCMLSDEEVTRTWMPYVRQELGAAGWVDRPRIVRRHPVFEPPAPDPFESIRTVRRAQVGPHLVRATIAGPGYAAVTSSVSDGLVVKRGPTRPTLREAIDDACMEIERLLAVQDGVSGR